MTWRVLEGDCRAVLATLPAESAQTCVTSPPYWGLRDYGHEGQLGLERTPDEYVARMVEVFREVRRVLRPDGTLWLNLGDSYAGSTTLGRNDAGRNFTGGGGNREGSGNPGRQGEHERETGLKSKDLVGIPWRVAFALQADGWWLRSDIVWAKPNPMPESVTDRPTKAHEYVFLLAKSERYFYDAQAVREGDEVYTRKGTADGHHLTKQDGYKGIAGGTLKRDPTEPYGFARDITTVGRNRRSVWNISTKPFSGAHFAVMPWDLVEPCVLAGSRPGDEVLDPFTGSGTVGMVARRHGRSFVGVELNPTYAAMARERIRGDAPLLNLPTEAA